MRVLAERLAVGMEAIGVRSYVLVIAVETDVLGGSPQPVLLVPIRTGSLDHQSRRARNSLAEEAADENRRSAFVPPLRSVTLQESRGLDVSKGFLATSRRWWHLLYSVLA